MNTEVRISEEATAYYQVVPWSLVACVLVVLVDCLLSEDGQQHAYTSAKHNGKNGVCQVIVRHGSDVVLGCDNECHIVRHYECSSTTADVM